MKANIYILKYMLLAVLVAFGACQRNEEEWIANGDRNVTIELSVSTADITRATPTAMEQAINSLRVYAFRNDKPIGYIFREATSAGTPFYMDLQLPESGIHDVEFYIIANEGEMADENSALVLSQNMSKSDLEAIKFTGLVEGKALPMYAKSVKSINVANVSQSGNSIEGHEGHFVLNESLAFSLYRPIAKLSLYGAKISGYGSNPQIRKAELLPAGTRQYNYLFPQEESILNAIPSRANSRVFTSSTVTITNSVEKGSSAAAQPENYTKVFENGYVSEVAVGASAWNQPSGSSNAAVLHVEYALGEGKEVLNSYIYLPALVRNHHIKVCILFNAEGQIVANYEVAEWDESEMQDYHFDYPTHSYLMEAIPTTADEGPQQPSAEATMAENRPFVGYFQMSKPGNDAWTPTLLGLNGNKCEIRVYDVESGNEMLNFPIDASEKWYRVEVWPSVGKMEVGKETMLAISYTASGLVESEFLLINGSTNNYYWPYSGSSAQDANYVIITMVN